MSVPNDPAQNPQPDVDVTVGSNPLVGDAPPSNGTGVDVTVNPQTRFRRAMDTIRHRLALEGSTVRPVPDRPGLGFHTAAARAAAFPGLQPEIEPFNGPGLTWGLGVAPPGGP
jgi:hypothetical protein